MSIPWADGFETYDDVGDATGYWDSFGTGSSIEQTIVRSAERALSVPDSSPGRAFGRSFKGNYTEVIWNCGVYHSAIPNRIGPFVLAQFRNSSNRAHVNIIVSPFGRLGIYIGGWDKLSSDNLTPVAESTLEIVASSWYMIQTKVVIGASGSVEVRVNGKTFVTYSGDTTGAPEGPDSIAGVFIGTFDSSVGGSFDDPFIIDDCWPQVREDGEDALEFLNYLSGVYYLPTVSEGTFNDFLLSEGSDRAALVDEVVPDEGSTFIYTPDVDDRQSFVVDDLPANVTTIDAIGVHIRGKKDENGVCDYQAGVYIAASEDYDTENFFTDSWLNYIHMWELNPDTSAAWIKTALPEVLIKRTG